MLKYFNSEYLTRYLLTLLFATLCWLPSIFLKTEIIADGQPLYQFYIWLSSDLFYLQMGIAYVISLLSALTTNNLLKTYGFTGKITTLGIFIMMLLQSAFWIQIGMSPFLWINVIFIFLFSYLYVLPSSINPIPTTFNAGLLLGSASLLYSPLIFLLPSLWYSFIIHRSASLRTLIVSSLGILTPILFALTWYYWNGNLDTAYESWLSSFIFDFKFNRVNDPLEIAIGVIIFILISGASLNTAFHLNEKNINLRRNLSLTLFVLINLLALLVMFQKAQIMAMLFIVPGSIILTHSLLQQRRQKWYNIILWVLCILVIANHYLHFIYA